MWGGLRKITVLTSAIHTEFVSILTKSIQNSLGLNFSMIRMLPSCYREDIFPVEFHLLLGFCFWFFCVLFFFLDRA